MFPTSWNSIQRKARALGVGLAFLLSSAAWSAPVNGVFTYQQPDGSTLQVRVVGDEFFAEEETLDGRHIIQDPITHYWCYAGLSKDGKSLESTGMIAADLRENSTYAGPVPKHLRLKTPREQRMRIVQANRERLGRDANGRFILPPTQAKTDLSMEGATTSDGIVRSVGGTTLGTKKGFTLLIRFPDRSQDVTISTTQVQNFCNQMDPHYTEFGNNGSVAEYFYDVSNGKLNYTNTVANYYTAKQNRSYYTDESASGRAQALVLEVLNALEASNFDFRTQDTDGNGVIDALNVFYAGPCVNAWAKGLWPHSGGVSWTSAKTGIRAGAYQMTDMGSSLELGTFCHENGHMLCHYPDVYDYDGDSQGGGGAFCLMDGGCFGTNPCAPNGYLRYKSGWGTAETITSSTNGTKTLTAESNGRLANPFLIYFNPSNSKEYFLIENRYKNDREAGLPTGGLAVWHVDEQGDHNKQNYAHNSSHNNFEVALIQADNQRHFERNVNANEANDLFYAGGASSQFSDTSDSGSYDNNAHWWNGSNSGMKLSSFSAQGNSMSLVVGGQTPPSIGITISPTTATITTGTQKQFSASVTGTTNTAVTWSCTGGGTASQTGLYTAPSTACTATVKATSVANSSKSASATVTVTTNNGGPTGYTWCAYENGSYSFTTKVDVAYGANGKYAYKSGVTGTITFNNATFGDPIVGVFKSGYYKKSATPTTVVKLYQHINYVGYVINLSEGSYTLSQLQALGMKNDDISSVTVASGYRVELYQYDNFGGTRLVKTSNDPTLVDDGFNDIVSSIKVIKQ